MSDTNHIWGFHVQYTWILAPLQYLITGTRPCILQRWIKGTIYNDESSKSRSIVVGHNTILCNLGYRVWTFKVFVQIQRNQYNPYHVNKWAKVKHGRNLIEFQKMSDANNWRKGVHQWWKWILRYHRKKFRSSSSGSTNEKPYCEEEGNRSSNVSQKWLGMG